MPEAFWSVDLDIYIFKTSMSHDLRVSLLTAIIIIKKKNKSQF